MRLKTLILVVLFALAAFGQTPTPTPTPAPVVTAPVPNPPTAVALVGEFNQLSTPKFAIGLSAIYTTSVQNGIGMYNTSTADVVPVKATDPATGRSFYAVSASFRQGIHERVLATGNLTVLLGADVGPGFSSTPSGGFSVSATGSFVVTSIYKINSYLSILAPMRMLYIQNVGWNPVFQMGVLINLKSLPAAK